MNKHSKYRPLLDKVEIKIACHGLTTYGLYRIMLQVLDEAEDSEASLKEEIRALRAENDAMCTGYLANGFLVAQVQSEAIRDFADYMQDPEIDPHGFNERAVNLADDYANEIEGK